MPSFRRPRFLLRPLLHRLGPRPSFRALHMVSPAASATPAPAPKRRRLSAREYSAMLRPPTITLDPDEEKVRSLLVDAAAEIDSTTPADEPLTLRFTGGWVRDKLLGRQCHDIDVGINRMTGYGFASRLAEFLEAHNDQYGIPARSIHKIESNPDKSKHLETATTKILDLDIDFVNLRHETYSSDSRIPQMEFGTPEEDALRRDACVNALFYNIHTREVEDFTGKGLDDMEARIIRTPLPPLQTFEDDPLRVLRLIRFSSRLGFTIDAEAKDAMQNPKIKKALRLKISRERVGTEVEKMLQGPDPENALSQIYDLGLFSAIFCPPIEALPELPIRNMDLAIRALSLLLSSSATDYQHLRRTLLPTPHEHYIAWLLVALSPWENYIFPGADTKKNIPGAATAAREGLKIPNKHYDIIVSSFRHLSMVANAVEDDTMNIASRGKRGMLFRRLGADWRSVYLCALLLETIQHWDPAVSTPSEAVEGVLGKYYNYLNRAVQEGVEDCWRLKPVLNGKELMTALELTKAGPWMSKALDQLMEWELENSGVEKDKAIEWARERKGDILDRAA